MVTLYHVSEHAEKLSLNFWTATAVEILISDNCQEGKKVIVNVTVILLLSEGQLQVIVMKYKEALTAMLSPVETRLISVHCLWLCLVPEVQQQHSHVTAVVIRTYRLQDSPYLDI